MAALQACFTPRLTRRNVGGGNEFGSWVRKRVLTVESTQGHLRETSRVEKNAIRAVETALQHFGRNTQEPCHQGELRHEKRCEEITRDKATAFFSGNLLANSELAISIEKGFNLGLRRSKKVGSSYGVVLKFFTEILWLCHPL